MMLLRRGVVAALSVLLLAGIAGNNAAFAAVNDSTLDSVASASPTAGSSEPDTGVETIAGKVSDGAESGCLILIAASGTYLLIASPELEEKLTVGATVTVTGKVKRDGVSTCMQGTPFVVSAVTVTDPDVQSLTGEVTAGVESGCLLLTVKSDTYLLLASPELKAKLTVGMTALVTGKADRSLGTTCQQGIPFVVSTVTDVGVKTFTGKVSEGVEAGCLILTAKDEKYLLILRPEVAIKVKVGTTVTVTGTFSDHLNSTCQEGTPFIVSGVTVVPEAGIERLTGTVRDGVESGCLVLTAGSGTYLLLGKGDSADKLKVGTTVTVTGKADRSLGTTCQEGIPFVVSGVTDPPKADAETLTGEVNVGVESNCLILKTKGGQYQLDLNPELAEYIKVGMTVTVTGKTAEDRIGICQQGSLFVVSGVLDAVLGVTDKPVVTSERLTGKVSAGTEAGCLILTTKSGTYLLLGRSSLATYAEVGMTVTVVGNTDPHLMTTCTEGIPFIVNLVTNFADADVDTLTGRVTGGSNCPLLKHRRGTYLLIVSDELAEKVTAGTTVTVTGVTDPDLETSCKAGLPFIVKSVQ